MPLKVVLAADVGATHTRIALAARGANSSDTPKYLARVDGPGFNIRSSGPATYENFENTIGEALSHLPTGAELHAAVFGISGAGPARHALIQERVREMVVAQALIHQITVEAHHVRVGDDLLTAFASAGEHSRSLPTGVLLLAGTGAATVAYAQTQEVRRRDGLGWLLGDIGSAVWLGRKALEAVAADLDGRGPRTLLTERVCQELGFAPRDPHPRLDPRQALIREVYELAPAEFGKFAPLVSELGDARRNEEVDAVARLIAAEAIEVLLDGALSLASNLTDGGHRPIIVVAGSVLTNPGPIGDLVRYGLESEGYEVQTAAQPLDGALALAFADAEEQ